MFIFKTAISWEKCIEITVQLGQSVFTLKHYIILIIISTFLIKIQSYTTTKQLTIIVKNAYILYIALSKAQYLKVSTENPILIED